MHKLWKTFFHIWKTTIWKKCGKLFSTCGKLYCGKNVEKFPHVENVCGKVENMWKTMQRKNAQKITLFCAKGRTKIFLKKSEKKEGKQESSAELLHCNV